jgi:hypothetical protein
MRDAWSAVLTLIISELHFRLTRNAFHRTAKLDLRKEVRFNADAPVSDCVEDTSGLLAFMLRKPLIALR